MDPKGLFSLTFQLFLSLAFEPSYGTGGRMMNCPKIVQQLGSDVLLPLTHERINTSMNKSIHIIVTMAKSLENSVENKIVSLDPSEAGPPRYLKDRYRFYLENLSLAIRESTKKDEGWYFMTLEKNISVQRFCLHLKLYEQVSTPEIKVLNKTQENGTCTLILGCTVKKGDHVAYSWSEKAGTHPLSPANSSHLLSLTLGPQHAKNIYVCTVSNPISNSSQDIVPWLRCRKDPSGECAGGSLCGFVLSSTTLTTTNPHWNQNDRCPGCLPMVKRTVTRQQQKKKTLRSMPKSRNQVLFRRNLTPSQLRTLAPPFTLLPQNLSQSLSRKQIPSQSMLV
uniref:Signaling lymphocytic activation molecule n=1 Tax=Saimiri boliviensis boliviensis TaxID=39432 RepID=A0A2K6V8I9_SAIBB